MTVQSCGYVSPFMLALSGLSKPADTTVDTIPNMVANSATGLWAALATAGADDVNYGQSTTAANYVYPTAGQTELAAGHGYATGGVDLHLAGSGSGGVPLGNFTVASNKIKFTTAYPILWTATDDTGLAAVTYVFFYCKHATNGKPVMFQLSLGGAFSATGNTATFTITPAAGGLMTLDLL